MKLIPVIFSYTMAVALAFAQTAGSPGEIRGSVIEPGINHGIEGAEITIRLMGPRIIAQPITTKEVAKITTDSQGNFRFQAPEFGEYILLVNKAGYTATGGNPMRGAVSTQVNTVLDSKHPNGEAHFLLGREGELTGHLVDYETDKPLANFAVNVQQFYYQYGLARVFPAGARAVSDAEGRFVAKGLRPGQYVVAVMPRVLPGKDQLLPQFSANDLKATDEDYRRSYWPGGGAQDTAQPVSVFSGASVDVGTIRLRKTPFYRAHVSVSDANCDPSAKVQIMIMIVGNQSTESNGSGETACGQDVLLRNYQPGRYTLILYQGKAPNRMRALLNFEVKDRNLDLTATLGRGLDIDGRFVAADGAGPIALDKLQTMPITLESTRFGDELQPISGDAQGRFRLANWAVMGKVQISLLPVSGSSTYIKEIRYNGIAVPDNVVTLNPGSAAQSLEILVDDQPATISGVVNDGDRTVDRPYVILAKWPLPVEPTYSPPKSMTGDADGKFQFTGLAPGEYRVFAVSQAARDKLDEPFVLQRMGERAERLNLARGGSQTLTVKLADPTR